MNTYEYIDTTGNKKTIQSDSPTAAMQAKDIGRTSGVRLITPPTPTPSAPTPTPTKKTTTPSIVDRYATDKKEIASVYDYAKPKESDIRRQEQANAQASIDVINNTFSRYIENDQQYAKELEAKQRAENMLGGLSGSTIGGNNAIDAQQKGFAKVQSTIQERDGLINQAISAANSRASSRFTTELDKYLANKKDKFAAEKELNEKIKTDAQSEIKTIASQRTFDEFSKANPALVKQYMKETGMDEATLKDYFLASTPQADFVDPQGTRIGNDTVFFKKKINPQTGQTDVVEAGRISGTGKEIQSTSINNGIITVLYKDGSYEQKGSPIKTGTGTGTGGKSVKSGGLVWSPEEFSAAVGLLDKTRGEDGYVNSQSYLQTYQDWKDKKGVPQDFLKTFPPKLYTNPNDETLPFVFRPTGTKETTDKVDKGVNDAKTYFKGKYGDAIDDALANQLAERVRVYIQGGRTYQQAVEETEIQSYMTTYNISYKAAKKHVEQGTQPE